VPSHFKPSLPSPCAITFQTQSTLTVCHHISNPVYPHRVPSHFKRSLPSPCSITFQTQSTVTMFHHISNAVYRHRVPSHFRRSLPSPCAITFQTHCTSISTLLIDMPDCQVIMTVLLMVIADINL